MEHQMDLPPAEAARLVSREVPELKDGKLTGQRVQKAVAADEVLACRLRGNVLVVVTTDGQKLTGEVPAGTLKKLAEVGRG